MALLLAPTLCCGSGLISTVGAGRGWRLNVDLWLQTCARACPEDAIAILFTTKMQRGGGCFLLTSNLSLSVIRCTSTHLEIVQVEIENTTNVGEKTTQICHNKVFTLAWGSILAQEILQNCNGNSFFHIYWSYERVTWHNMCGEETDIFKYYKG